MAGFGTHELGKVGKKKAKTGSLGDGPSSLPSFSSLWRGRMARVGDRTAAEGDGDEEFELPAEEGSRDPLVVFGSGIMLVILSKLDARSVALARLVSRGWLVVASSDKIWAPKVMVAISQNKLKTRKTKASRRYTGGAGAYYGLISGKSLNPFIELECEDLWMGKAHIPRMSKIPGLPKMVACSLSIMDGKRTRVTRVDLCDHVWEFHFAQAAPEYWRELDPYWQGSGAPMRRYFHPDGSITADPDDKVWGGHESSYTVVTGLLADGKIREHYVRINRWPKMSVHRRPDWGWVLSNHLYCYTSIPDAATDGGTGPSFPLLR